MTERTYDPAAVEKKWQQYWDESGTNEIDLAAAKNPYYVLMMFPYPSAEGLHVGNVYAFTGADIQGRYRRLKGFDVFEPIGFDAFGIHSENFAMKINRHPRELIPANVANFTRQLKMMGLMYDWRRTVDTTSPEYYKWTQWVFLQLYKAGLAYRDEKEVNFCPKCGTVIADEQVNTDGTCERHGDTPVERRRMPCWFFRITEFADRLVENHQWLDWSETTKIAQLNWIGRSEGAEVDFEVAGSSEKIRVFTTRPDTLFGATFMVLAPEHPTVDRIAAAGKREAIEAYRKRCAEQKKINPEGGSGVSPESDHVLGLQEDLRIREGAFLPHWTQENTVHSITFRLADSLPAEVAKSYKLEREDILVVAEKQGRPLSEDEAARLSYLFSDKIEAYLDRSVGACLLRDDRAAQIVADALRYFEGKRYKLLAWCVMPNHVHVVFQPFAGEELSSILHSWKSFTAKEINKALGRNESEVWQTEYFDHIVRNEASLERSIAYAWENPAKANLKNWRWRWRLAVPGLGQDAQATLKEKTGIDTGARAVNPVNGEQIPIFIADYVMMGYGTGAIMAVPSGDHRDFAFAKKFGLPIKPIVSPSLKGTISRDEYSGIDFIDGAVDSDAERDRLRRAVEAGEAAWSGAGTSINSSNAEIVLDGLPKEDAIAAINAWLETRGVGHSKRQYRLRDWGISRQRYWGPPIPILYDENGEAHPVPESMLPVTLPDLDDFRPKGDGRGPLANAPDWVNVEINGKKYRRETDVMDNFLDSAWYYLRYVSSRDDDRAYDPALIDKWLPVDLYIGGNEHAVLHLLYTRFVCMGLEKAKALKMGARPEMRDRAEPFRKFRAHGLLIKNGSKMSKSKGNVVNPDEFVAQHGADTLRTYLMFLGPYTHGGDFRDKDIMGVRRFFNRVHDWYFGGTEIVPDADMRKEARVKLHQTIKKCGEDFEALSYNTAVAALMELLNALRDAGRTSAFARESFCVMLAPFAPHLAEEIWREALGNKKSVFTASWPAYEPALTVLDEIEIPIQINGKVRDKVVVPREASNTDLEAAARACPGVQKALEKGGAIKKAIVVPGRLVNLIVQ